MGIIRGGLNNSSSRAERQLRPGIHARKNWAPTGMDPGSREQSSLGRDDALSGQSELPKPAPPRARSVDVVLLQLPIQGALTDTERRGHALAVALALFHEAPDVLCLELLQVIVAGVGRRPGRFAAGLGV